MINKNHPKYAEYEEKCSKLRDEYYDKSKSVPLQHGLDGPNSLIDREFAKKLRAVQEEYSFLFEQAFKIFFNGGVKMLIEIIKNKRGGKTLKIDGNVIEPCAEVNIYERPGEATRVEITLINVDVKIEN